jgi:hypothetical protein
MKGYISHTKKSIVMIFILIISIFIIVGLARADVENNTTILSNSLLNQNFWGRTKILIRK